MAWRHRHLLLTLSLVAAGAALSGCGMSPPGEGFRHLSERDCMARVMFFESNRSSTDGMIAVGTVVENRRASGQHPATVCGVVGERNQFAEGALWKRMSGPGRDRAYEAADAVLSGARHPGVGSAQYFHTADRWYPYSNMHYVTVAGGNAFYEKRSRYAPTTVAWNQPAWNRRSWNQPATAYGRPSASAAAEASARPAPAYARAAAPAYAPAAAPLYARAATPAPAYAPAPAAVAERGTIDAGDRVRLAKFLNTGQGLYQ
jgi:cell wall hydrolase